MSPWKRPTPRDRRPSQARERILRAADRLFYQEGIHAVGINRIVEESGVTRVTLYRHFPSKDDLISAYLDAREVDDRNQVLGLLAAHPDDPRRTLTELATVLTDDDSRRWNAAVRSSTVRPSSPGRTLCASMRGAIDAWITGIFGDLLTPSATAPRPQPRSN